MSEEAGWGDLLGHWCLSGGRGEHHLVSEVDSAGREPWGDSPRRFRRAGGQESRVQTIGWCSLRRAGSLPCGGARSWKSARLSAPVLFR